MGPHKTLAILLTGTALSTWPAMAQEVGTATAVNPESQSTAPVGQTVTLKVGARVVHKERIKTTASGTVQLLFLDKSTLSIGPNSNILIDEYVYNPSTGRGHMVASVLRGALRYVGGALSHQGEAKITSPLGTLGIRGGTAIINYDSNGMKVINLYGTNTFGSNCGSLVLRRPGFTSTIANVGSCPSPPIAVTAAEIAYFIELFTSRFGQNGGVAGLTDALLAEFGIGGLHGFIGPNAPPNSTNNGESNAFELLIQAIQHGTDKGLPPLPPPPPPRSPPPPPPPPLTVGG